MYQKEKTYADTLFREGKISEGNIVETRLDKIEQKLNELIQARERDADQVI